MAIKLPVIGTDWLDGCVGKYIIVSLKHSTPGCLYYWKANSLGYTNFPFTAGMYTKSEVDAHPVRFNDGYNAVAVPLTATALGVIGFPCGLSADTDYKIFDQFCNISIPDPEAE